MMTRKIARLLLSLAMSLMVLAVPAQPAQAAVTITVTTTSMDIVEDDQCSLPEAMYNAVFLVQFTPPGQNPQINDCPAGAADGSTIELQAGQTYTLNGAGFPAVGAGTPGATAFIPIAGVRVTINGNGSAIRAGVGNGQYRAFSVLPGPANRPGPGTFVLNDITIADFTIPNGGAEGAVFSDNSTMVINRSRFTNNRGVQGQTGGGAVSSQATGSGQTNTTIADSIFTNNTSLSTDAGSGNGGGISTQARGNATARTTIVRSHFANNIVTNNGGAVGNFSFDNATATTTIDQSSIIGNQATGIIGGPNATDGFGGGVNNFAASINSVASMIITNTTISGNRAGAQGQQNGYGGGVFHETACGQGNPCGLANMTLEHVTIANNSAGQEPNPAFPLSRGGGIWVNDQAVTPVTPSNRVSTVVRNILVANNTPTDCRDVPGTFNRQGFNISTDGTAPRQIEKCGFAELTSAQVALGPLTTGPNGFLQYHPLQPGSQAIDRVPTASCTLTVDEINNQRPRGSLCDVGAIEAAPAVPVVCNPRPQVNLNVRRDGQGGLLVTVSSTSNPTGTPNSLRELLFRRIDNAQVTQGQTVINPTNPRLTLPAAATETTFTVRRGSQGAYATVELTVTDACGSMSKFVGGGPQAFQ